MLKAALGKSMLYAGRPEARPPVRPCNLSAPQYPPPPSRHNSITIFGARSFRCHYAITIAPKCTKRKAQQQRHIIALHKARLVFMQSGIGTAVIMYPYLSVKVAHVPSFNKPVRRLTISTFQQRQLIKLTI